MRLLSLSDKNCFEICSYTYSQHVLSLFLVNLKVSFDLHEKGFIIWCRYIFSTVACECHNKGSSSSSRCNYITGQCSCVQNVGGQKCDRCVSGYFGFPRCRPCVCNPIGTLTNITRNVCASGNDEVKCVVLSLRVLYQQDNKLAISILTKTSSLFAFDNISYCEIIICNEQYLN